MKAQIPLQMATPHGRQIGTGTYTGHGIRIVVGYDIQSDAYLAHLYITDPSGVEQKTGLPEAKLTTAEEGFDLALGQVFATLG